MSGYEIEIAVLRSAANAARSAADQARAMHPGSGLAALAAALPGGQTAMMAPALAFTFDDRAASWAAEIEGWSENVSATARHYAENDDAARKAFDS